jgi:opacity protein-like surface antigen
MTTCRGFRRLVAVVARKYRLPKKTSARSEPVQVSKVDSSVAKESKVTSSHPLWTLLICGLIVQPVAAQGFNLNVGGGPGFPLSRTGNFANTSYNFVAGGGPRNLAPHVKLVGEFMFHGLPVKQSASNEAQIPSAKGRLYAVTGNLIVGGGDRKGAYLIGGGGWYRRTVETQATQFVAGEACGSVLVLWNVQCMNGVFPSDVTLGSHSSNAAGFNIGGGLTFAIGKAGAHLYTEVRYHRAFTDGIDTTVLPLTFGVRW